MPKKLLRTAMLNGLNLGLSMAILGVGIAACNSGKSSSNSQKSHQISGFKKVTVTFISTENQQALNLDQIQNDYIGIGVFKDNKLVATSRLEPTENSLIVPMGSVTLRAILVSSRPSSGEVFTAQAESEQAITETTDALNIQFGAYKKAEVKTVFGLAYESDEKPAQDYAIAIIDPFSSSIIDLPTDSNLALTDSRGVFALNYFLGGDKVRLRLKKGTISKEVLLNLGESADKQHYPLPFVNLTGSNQRSPFLIDLNLLRGANGINGTNGTNGKDGANGSSVKIITEAEPKGSNCPHGGSKISSWTQAAGTNSNVFNEANGSSNLQVSYICSTAIPGLTDLRRADGTQLGKLLNTAEKAYLAVDNRYIELNTTELPGTLVPADEVNFDNTFSPDQHYLAFSSPNCSGTAASSRKSSLAQLFGTVYLTTADLSAGNMGNKISALSAFQQGFCHNLGERTNPYSLKTFTAQNRLWVVINESFNAGVYSTTDGTNWSGTSKASGLTFVSEEWTAEFYGLSSSVVALAPTPAPSAMVTPTAYPTASPTPTLHSFVTTNNGDSWAATTFSKPPTNNRVNKTFISSNNVVLAATDYEAYRSANNGATWELAAAFNGYSIMVQDGDNVIVADNSNSEYKIKSFNINSNPISISTGLSYGSYALWLASLAGQTFVGTDSGVKYQSNLTADFAPASGLPFACTYSYECRIVASGARFFGVKDYYTSTNFSLYSASATNISSWEATNITLLQNTAYTLDSKFVSNTYWITFDKQLWKSTDGINFNRVNLPWFLQGFVTRNINFPSGISVPIGKLNAFF